MFNLELLWHVAKGAVSAATYRTAVSLLWPLPLSSGKLLLSSGPNLREASGEEPLGRSLREAYGKP